VDAQVQPLDITVDGGTSHYFQVFVDSNNPAFAPSIHRIASVFAGARTQGFHIPPLMHGKSRTAYSGAHTVFFLYYNGVTGVGSWTRLDQNPKYQFDVTIHPAQ
jgi:hypothetical protein